MNPAEASKQGIEMWAFAPGFDNLIEISNLGRVYHHAHQYIRPNQNPLMGQVIVNKRGGFLKPIIAGGGYPSVRINKVTYKVANLVALAFIGERPSPTHQVRHLDDDRENSRLYNIAYGTKKENHADRVRNGIDIKGEKHGNAVLTEAQVIVIKQRLQKGDRQTTIASDYGVHTATVHAISSGVNWKHLN